MTKTQKKTIEEGVGRLKENIQNARSKENNRLAHLVAYYYCAWSPFIGMGEDKKIRQLCYEICKQVVSDIVEEIVGEDERFSGDALEDAMVEGANQLRAEIRQRAKKLGIKI